jgi:hypothetical protein
MEDALALLEKSITALHADNAIYLLLVSWLSFWRRFFVCRSKSETLMINL